MLVKLLTRCKTAMNDRIKQKLDLIVSSPFLFLQSVFMFMIHKLAAHLLSETPSGRLTVSAEHHRFAALRLEPFFDQISPETTRCTHFGNFHVEVHGDAPEEAESGGEVVDMQPCVEACLAILNAVCNRKCHLQHCICSCFLKLVGLSVFCKIKTIITFFFHPFPSLNKLFDISSNKWSFAVSTYF